MYEDAWYNAFAPGTSSRPELAHHRRVSVLQKPHDEPTTDVEESRGPSFDVARGPSPIPHATVARRAQSYSDFYDAVKSYLQNDSDAVQQQQAGKKTRRLSDASERTDSDSEEIEDMTDSLIDASHAQYQAYLDQLRMSRQHVDSLIKGTDDTLALLSGLSASFDAVDSQTTAFRSRCEGLLAEQRRITSLADGISDNLKYYDCLDPITRRLNAPGAGRFVRGENFSFMLAQLDDCIEYMQAHPNQSEAATYGSRYRQLLTRGLTLIRVHFTNSIREIATDVAKRIADRQLNDTTMPALLYAKFRVGAAELKQLCMEIQKRARPPADAEPGQPGEYQSLVNELHQSYSGARGRLIVPLVRRKMEEISLAPTTATDIVAFARSSISYFKGLCADECELWHEWFDGDDGLYDFLEVMCEPLYDYLRPRTVRETQLPKLCDMCSLIQIRYMDEDEEESDGEEKPNQLEFAPLIRPALQDAQNRLVFLALAVLRDEIERFKPKATDLDYPRKTMKDANDTKENKGPVLSGRKSSVSYRLSVPKDAAAVEDDSSDALELRWKNDANSDYHTWYATLKKAVWLLSRIYRLVNSSVFDDLAHRVVHQTTISLVYASQRIAAAKPDPAANDTKNKTKTPSKINSPPINAQLFLLRQLLTLKHQLIAFDIEHSTGISDRDIDLSHLSSTLTDLRSRGAAALFLSPRALASLATQSLLPGVVDNMLDARTELDAILRKTIEDFTATLAKEMTLAIEGDPQATNFDGGKAVRLLRATVEKSVPLLRRKLAEHLDDVRTRETLVAAVQEATQGRYEDFYAAFSGTAESNGAAAAQNRGGSKKHGKGREGDVWDPDTFADWLVSAFGVAHVGQELDEDGDEIVSPST